MYQLLTPPLTEPLTVDELKAALRIDHSDDDQLVQSMAVTARTFIERRLGYAFLQQTWSLKLSDIPPAAVRLRPGPVPTPVSVMAKYGEGALEAIPDADWHLDFANPTRICLMPAPMQDGECLTGIEVIFTAGASDASTIPADLLRALYLLTAHYYEERELFRAQRYVAVPMGIEALLEPYRELSL